MGVSILRRARALSSLGRLITTNYEKVLTLVSDTFAYRSPHNNLFLRFAYPQVEYDTHLFTSPSKGQGKKIFGFLFSEKKVTQRFRFTKFESLKSKYSEVQPVDFIPSTYNLSKRALLHPKQLQ